LSLPTIQPHPTRALYVTAVVLVCLFVMGFLWLIQYAVISPLRAGIVSSMSQYDVTNSTYQNFELADAFMLNLWTYFLVIVVLGLLYWVWHYSQRRAVYP